MRFNMKKIFGFPILFGRRRRAAIEFTVEWVKLAESVWTPKGYRLSKFIAKRMTDIKDALSSAILDLLKEMDIKRGAITLIIPRHLVTFKYLELPSTDEAEIQEILDLQITKQTPYSRQEIIYGFKVISGVKEGYSNVLLAIAKKDVVEERLNLLKNSGLEIESVAISSGMTYRNFLLSDEYKNILAKTGILIDVDAQSSDILLIDRGELVFTRSILVGRETILKGSTDLKSKFTAELKAALEVYRHETERPEVEIILFTGAISGLTDTLTFVRNEFNLPLVAMNQLDMPLFSKKTSNSIEGMTEMISLSAICGAVHARSDEKPDINLLPLEFEIEREMKFKAKNISHTGILGVLILILLSAILLERFYREKSYYEILHSKFLMTEGESADIERMKLKLGAIRKYQDRKNSPVNILQALINATPKEIYFHNIVYTKDKKVVLTGFSEKMSDVFKFVSVLERLDFFEKIKTNYAAKKQKDGKEIIDFELVCPLQD